MPYSGGTFTRLYNWSNDALNGIDINSSRMDGEDNDFAFGLSQCILKDGSQTITANIPFNGFNITGIANGVNPQDAAAFGQLSSFAPLASPAFTGAPSLPTGTTGVTQATGNSTTALATTAFVNGTALTLTTGTTAITPTAADNSTKVATTAFVNGTALTLAAGSTAPTQAVNDSSTKVATTAFANPSATVSASGTNELPSGLVIKWGVTTSLGTGSQAFTFPVAFPTACFMLTVMATNGASTNTPAITAKSASGATIQNSTGNGQSFYYIAIGN